MDTWKIPKDLLLTTTIEKKLSVEISEIDDWSEVNNTNLAEPERLFMARPGYA